jgi:hypothetical protein
MSPNTREWIINGALMAGIAVFLVLIGTGQFTGDKEDQGTGLETPAPTPTPLPGPINESVYGIFPNIGTLAILRELVTPPPTPTPPPPTPAPTPSLERAIKNWQFEYFLPSRQTYIFSIKGAPPDGPEIRIKVGEFVTAQDPGTRQDMKVTAKPGTARNRVIVESSDGQTFEFGVE